MSLQKKAGTDQANPMTKIKAAINTATTTNRQLCYGPKFKNQLISKIVDYLKLRFLDLEETPLPLPAILKAIDEENIADSFKIWIQREGAKFSKRLKLTAQGEFYYSPPLPCRDRSSLLSLLKDYDLKGLGGIYRTDIENSVPNSERILKSLEKYIIMIAGPDKVQIAFYHDKQSDLGLSSFIKDAWNSTDNPDIEMVIDKLKQNKDSVMEQWTSQNVPEERSGKEKKKRDLNNLRDNKHVAHLLMEFPGGDQG